MTGITGTAVSYQPTRAETYQLTAHYSAYNLNSAPITLTVTQQPTPPVADSSISGNMDNAYHALFETSGGSLISPVAGLSSGDVLAAPPPPAKEGYTFGGGFTDEDCTKTWDFANGIPGDITLYAKWIGGGLVAPVTGTQTQSPGDTRSATVQSAVESTTTTLRSRLPRLPPVSCRRLGRPLHRCSGR